MNQILDTKYKYLSEFFKTAIEQNRLFHSLIFYGSNNYLQYAMALELARQLNCLGDKSENCDCQNCRWIRENKHPEVVTISKIDSKTDSSKTVISEEQVNIVLDKLINSSDYHRVFIFCDAELKKLTDEENKEYQEYLSTGFNVPQMNTEEKIWYPSGMNTSCFSSVAANSMLKTIEEPQSDVTFIFLTNNKDDLLQTIVSRSQAFYIADVKDIKYTTDFFSKFFVNYPNFDKNSALNFAQTLLNYQTDNNLSAKYVLDCLQYYLTECAKSNYNNLIIVNIILQDIQRIEKSKKMLDSYIKDQTVYEDLAFYFTRKNKI